MVYILCLFKLLQTIDQLGIVSAAFTPVTSNTSDLPLSVASIDTENSPTVGFSDPPIPSSLTPDGVDSVSALSLEHKEGVETVGTHAGDSEAKQSYPRSLYEPTTGRPPDEEEKVSSVVKADELKMREMGGETLQNGLPEATPSHYRGGQRGQLAKSSVAGKGAFGKKRSKVHVQFEEVKRRQLLYKGRPR